MKLVLAPTEPVPPYVSSTYPTVEISYPSDHLDLDDVFDQLVLPALRAYGFSITSVEFEVPRLVEDAPPDCGDYCLGLIE